MLLAREFVGYLSRQLVNRLTPTNFEVSNPVVAAPAIAQIIEDDLSVEDKLNDEAREMLEQYSDYMRQENISYQDMFRKIKRQLLVRDKIMPAAGRDSGDSSMKLSRDKVNDLAHKIVTAMRKSREFRVRKDPNDLRLALVREMTELLQLEDKIDKAARQKVRGQKRDIAEGGEEYDLLHKRYYAEELKKLGISLNA
ncbi:MAG TPA: DUF507 family protein [Bryobacteraceae bacterium]|jgi:hypothetical protein